MMLLTIFVPILAALIVLGISKKKASLMSGVAVIASFITFLAAVSMFGKESAFLLPWALNRGTLNGHAVAAVTIFIGLVVFMLAYFWRKGSLSCR